jgi:cytochrome c556
MLAMSLPAQAQFAKSEDAIKYRKNSFFVMQQHWARVGAMTSGRVPFDAKLAQENMEIVSVLSKMPWAAFGDGTEKGDTRAKQEIWKESVKFKEHAEKFQAEVTKVNIAAKAGNIDALKAAFGPAAASCKACHDSFRKD